MYLPTCLKWALLRGREFVEGTRDLKNQKQRAHGRRLFSFFFFVAPAKGNQDRARETRSRGKEAKRGCVWWRFWAACESCASSRLRERLAGRARLGWGWGWDIFSTRRRKRRRGHAGLVGRRRWRARPSISSGGDKEGREWQGRVLELQERALGAARCKMQQLKCSSQPASPASQPSQASQRETRRTDGRSADQDTQRELRAARWHLLLPSFPSFAS